MALTIGQVKAVAKVPVGKKQKTLALGIPILVAHVSIFIFVVYTISLVK